MGITPLDIQNKEFERSFRGYDIEDVDEFLDRIAKDMEQLIRENQDLKEQVSTLQEKNKNYRAMEETMHNAILLAQETAEEVKQSAKREADLIRREAEKEGQKIVEEARYRSGRVLSEHEELYKQAQLFKMRFRSFVETQLAALESESWMDREPREQQKAAERPSFETRDGFDTRSEFERRSEFTAPSFQPRSDFQPKPEENLQPPPPVSYDVPRPKDEDNGEDPDF